MLESCSDVDFELYVGVDSALLVELTIVVEDAFELEGSLVIVVARVAVLVRVLVLRV